jgi:hypothetical protein
LFGSIQRLFQQPNLFIWFFKTGRGFYIIFFFDGSN